MTVRSDHTNAGLIYGGHMVLIAALMCSVCAAFAQADDYKLGPGDTVKTTKNR